MQEFPGIDTHTSYLTHPLVLIGLALLVFFGLYKTLSARGVAPPVGPRAGGRVTQALLRHGIVIALLVILFGLGMAFYERRQDAHIRENLDVLRGFGENEGPVLPFAFGSSLVRDSLAKRKT